MQNEEEGEAVVFSVDYCAEWAVKGAWVQEWPPRDGVKGERGVMIDRGRKRRQGREFWARKNRTGKQLEAY